MSKGPNAAEKPKEKPGAPHAAGHEAHAPAAPRKGKNNEEGGSGFCTAKGCKASSKRFGFCDEHYDHFKFGLIKKNGEQVMDYEKKIEHYMAYKAKTTQSGMKKAA